MLWAPPLVRLRHHNWAASGSTSRPPSFSAQTVFANSATAGPRTADGAGPRRRPLVAQTSAQPSRHGARGFNGPRGPGLTARLSIPDVVCKIRQAADARQQMSCRHGWRAAPRNLSRQVEAYRDASRPKDLIWFGRFATTRVRSAARALRILCASCCMSTMDPCAEV